MLVTHVAHKAGWANLQIHFALLSPPLPQIVFARYALRSHVRRWSAGIRAAFAGPFRPAQSHRHRPSAKPAAAAAAVPGRRLRPPQAHHGRRCSSSTGASLPSEGQIRAARLGRPSQRAARTVRMYSQRWWLRNPGLEITLSFLSSIICDIYIYRGIYYFIIAAARTYSAIYICAVCLQCVCVWVHTCVFNGSSWMHRLCLPLISAGSPWGSFQPPYTSGPCRDCQRTAR